MRFKNISALELSVSPTKLKEARSTVYKKYDKYMNSAVNDQKWPSIYRKIQNEKDLKFRDLKYSLFKTDELNDPEKSFLIKQFRGRFNETALVEGSFLNILNMLKPWPSVQIFLSLSGKVDVSLEPYKFVIDNREIVEQVNSLEDFQNTFLKDVASIEQLNTFYEKSDVMAKMTKSYLMGVNTKDKLFNDETKEFVGFLFSIIPFEFMTKVLENYLGNYLRDTPNWSALILDKENTLNKLISKLDELNFPKKEHGERLKIVFNKYHLSQDVISELKRLSQERGDYWEHKLKNFDSIDVKKFGSRKYGLAMFIKDFVVVEFAPTGNAAFFYKKEVFVSEVQESLEWSVPSKAGISIGQGSFFRNKALRDINKGRFRHTPKRWTGDMDRILKVLSDV
jgi:hypothetical protein